MKSVTKIGSRASQRHRINRYIIDCIINYYDGALIILMLLYVDVDAPQVPRVKYIIIYEYQFPHQLISNRSINFWHAFKLRSRERRDLRGISRNGDTIRERKKGGTRWERSYWISPTLCMHSCAHRDGINIPSVEGSRGSSSRSFNDGCDTILICRRATKSGGVFEGFGVIN